MKAALLADRGVSSIVRDLVGKAAFGSSTRGFEQDKDTADQWTTRELVFEVQPEVTAEEQSVIKTCFEGLQSLGLQWKKASPMRGVAESRASGTESQGSHLSKQQGTSGPHVYVLPVCREGGQVRPSGGCHGRERGPAPRDLQLSLHRRRHARRAGLQGQPARFRARHQSRVVQDQQGKFRDQKRLDQTPAADVQVDRRVRKDQFLRNLACGRPARSPASTSC